jgi:hypothetical protein
MNAKTKLLATMSTSPLMDDHMAGDWAVNAMISKRWTDEEMQRYPG